MNYRNHREQFLAWLRTQLIGPSTLPGPIRQTTPMDRYPTGLLFPVLAGEADSDQVFVCDDVEDVSEENINEGEFDAGPAVKPRRYVPPSSVGFSFFARGEVVRFHVRSAAIRYKNTGMRDERGRFLSLEYDKSSLGGDGEAPTFEAVMSKNRMQHNDRRDVFEGCAGIDVLWRPFSDGWIVTVSLFNKQEWDSDVVQRNEKSLFSVELQCFMENGEVATYPHVDKSLLSEEEQELELQYKNRHIYAVGHGAAVNWDMKDGAITEIRTEFMPAVEVPQVTADVGSGGDPVLSLSYLSSDGDTENLSDGVLDDLDRFVDEYLIWIAGQQDLTNGLEPDEKSVGSRITERMVIASRRMKSGVDLLRRDRLAAQAFRLANRVILDQMHQVDAVRKKSRKRGFYRWRPFQLAFLLMVIESAINEDDEYRDIVDLIWFPTGGGKTEAYLGLIAFLIVWRRLKYPASCGGTTVIMRYTLRLLTAQQYQRATKMICALELLRRKDPRLGTEPISIGLWVGDAASPNKFDKAMKILQKARGGSASSLQSLVLDKCPWCGSVFQAQKNYVATETKFQFRCLNSKCAFSDSEYLPCNVVDEALYDSPPTLLLATVDKFARLAWDERSGAFFGVKSNRPPELIIQDELHLIAGALGSIAGIYEAALDTVLTQRGVHPKYVAATATIRMAKQQVESLYGRDLAIFPPPGLSCDDSYFARTVPLDQRPGRLYVGYLAPMLNRQTCMAPLAAALLVAPEAMFGEGVENREDLLEAWWSQVVYHGSLKEVGNSHNAFNIDVRDIVQRLADEIHQQQESNGESYANKINRVSTQIAQLTSLSSAEENARTFARLEQTYHKEDCLDAVLATNMVSVGLDVSRLALMVINGQPLTTAEYIQASSRVGRSDVPGLVVTNYYRDQARSLSHYEDFRPYHDSFYRFVEPTSVTPFTYQARKRALHAALVITIRHSCADLRGNNQAGKFNPHAENVRKVVSELKLRCAQADPGRKQESSAHLDDLVEEWWVEAQFCENQRCQLVYEAPKDDKADRRLLYNHDDKIHGLWVTPQSMRNVENTALLEAQ